jgi:hypothetical protein
MEFLMVMLYPRFLLLYYPHRLLMVLVVLRQKVAVCL